MLSLDNKILGVAFLFNKISSFITDTLIEGNVIKNEEKNLYLYCFGTIIEMSANLLATLLIGAMLHRFIETLIFMIVFIPIRSFAGGYHCEKAESCFILSISVYLSVILSYKYLYCISVYWVYAIYLADLISVFILSPVVSPNKPLSEKGKNKNRCISIFITALYITAASVMLYCKIPYAFVILESVTASVISMTAGYLKYRKCHKSTVHCSKTTIHAKFDTKCK